jgi:hypothetical protein
MFLFEHKIALYACFTEYKPTCYNEINIKQIFIDGLPSIYKMQEKNKYE